jgi:DNA topoisomerase-2
MYVGSKTFRIIKDYVWINNKLMKKDINVSPALVRVFLEILSNAVDNWMRDNKMTKIVINLSSIECEITNDGASIPINKNNNANLYNHTLIFGHLLTGSNYDDCAIRFTSGRNGLGAKLTNVYSKIFTIEGIDVDQGLKFTQTWTHNMRETAGPIITKTTLKKNYTTVKFQLDFPQFDIKQFPQDVLELYGKYAVDAAMLTGLNVTLNGNKLPNKLNDYFGLINDITEVLKIENDNIRVWVQPSQYGFEAISFVNGINTKLGGKHVDAAVEAVCRPIITKFKTITLRDVKDYFRFLVVTSVPNPTFEGQEKNVLESPSLKLNHITPYQLGKILKWPTDSGININDAIKNRIGDKDKKMIVKNIKESVGHIEGYDKANYSGTNKSSECVLIICEGLSAKTFAVSGISFSEFYGKMGRNWIGIYALRGKLLNTRNATPLMISKNTIITNLMKILGLNIATSSKFDKLNYGKLCILTDADVDGIHIEGLVLNFIHSIFPSLLDKQFVVSMKTPILKITNTGKIFYDERTFKKAIKSKNDKIKYYKGLGTIKPADVKDVFGIKVIEYFNDKLSNENFCKAFDKSFSDDRKLWLEKYDPDADTWTLDDMKERYIKYPISKFLNDELIKFFYDDCARSLPSVYDGFKESERKIFYGAMKRKLITDLKVAQFGAYVAEHTHYHHGENNLFNTIINMAQSYPGTNNIPLFYPEGNFGTRLSGGEDAASPRYIYTKLTKEAIALFPEDDNEIYEQKMEETDLIEPYYYVPILPMLLINGCLGIGSGWMCYVPTYSPSDVIKNATRIMNGLEILPMIPWYKGFTGPVTDIGDGRFETKGLYNIIGNTLNIWELPIGMWNDKFVKYCSELSTITKINDTSTPDKPAFHITVKSDFDVEAFDKKMTTFVNVNNMVVFDKREKITRVTINDIFTMWAEERLRINEIRKNYKIKILENNILDLGYKITFITLVKNKIIILTESETLIREKMSKNDLKDESIQTKLLALSIRTLSYEKREELEAQKNKLIKELTILKKLTLKEIWEIDLSKFKHE